MDVRFSVNSLLENMSFGEFTLSQLFAEFVIV